MGRITIEPSNNISVISPAVQAEQVLLDTPELFTEDVSPKQIIEVHKIEIRENPFDESELKSEINNLKHLTQYISLDLDSKAHKKDLQEIVESLRTDKVTNMANLSGVRVNIENNYIELLAKLSELEKQINIVDNKKVTEIIRLKPHVPKMVSILLIINLILTLIALIK